MFCNILGLWNHLVNEHADVFFALCPWNKVPCSGPDNLDLLPLGPELEAEGQHDNYYYSLSLANPDYPEHSCAFMRA